LIHVGEEIETPLYSLVSWIHAWLLSRKGEQLPPKQHLINGKEAFVLPQNKGRHVCPRGEDACWEPDPAGVERGLSGPSGDMQQPSMVGWQGGRWSGGGQGTEMPDKISYTTHPPFWRFPELDARDWQKVRVRVSVGVRNQQKISSLGWWILGKFRLHVNE
jgi:hypothetical protein